MRETKVGVLSGFIVTLMIGANAYLPASAQVAHPNGIWRSAGCNLGVAQFLRVPANQRRFGFGGTTLNVCKLSPVLDSPNGEAFAEVTLPVRHPGATSTFQELNVWISGPAKDKVTVVFCFSAVSSPVIVPISFFTKIGNEIDGWQNYGITADDLQAFDVPSSRLNKVTFELEQVASGQTATIGKLSVLTSKNQDFPTAINFKQVPCSQAGQCP